MSRDKVLENEHQYPLEFINSLTPLGFPPYVLNLKKHVSVMLIRNLRPHNGYVNGCQYCIWHFMIMSVKLSWLQDLMQDNSSSFQGFLLS